MHDLLKFASLLAAHSRSGLTSRTTCGVRPEELSSIWQVQVGTIHASSRLELRRGSTSGRWSWYMAEHELGLKLHSISRDTAREIRQRRGQSNTTRAARAAQGCTDDSVRMGAGSLMCEW